jgi:hypothetical protein
MAFSPSLEATTTWGDISAVVEPTCQPLNGRDSTAEDPLPNNMGFTLFHILDAVYVHQTSGDNSRRNIISKYICWCEIVTQYDRTVASRDLTNSLFAWLIGHQPAVLFSQNKPAPAISHQPNEQAVKLSPQEGHLVNLFW